MYCVHHYTVVPFSINNYCYFEVFREGAIDKIVDGFLIAVLVILIINSSKKFGP